MFIPHRLRFAGLAVVWALLAALPATPAVEGDVDATSGTLSLTLRDRLPSDSDPEVFHVRERPQKWEAKKTAIVICDMWDLHHCKRAVDRVTEMAPRMNEVVSKARDLGVFIIHAPSGCTDPYKDTPMRKRARAAPKAANLPKDIAGWCNRIPAEEKGRYPIDQADGGEDDEPREHVAWAAKLAGLGRDPRAPWKRECDLLTMDERDAVSDSGVEIWNLLEQRGIDNVILMGVHANMCVLGRPFGLRQLAKNGKHVVLMRDMTDTMYNPARWPHVSHFRGTDLIVEHVEKHVCPTVTSDQILGGRPFRFRDDIRPRALVAISEDEYKTEQTLPEFVRDMVQDRLGVDVRILLGDGKPPHDLPGVAAALENADLLLVSMRRRSLPAADLQAVRKFIAAGKPVVGIRTASHAFDDRGKLSDGRAVWPEFGAEILGSNYTGHHDSKRKTTVMAVQESARHPILTGVRLPLIGHGSLYKVSPLAKTATPLLTGSIPNQPVEPVAWVNGAGRAQVFYTSLGSPEDFQTAAFRRLLANAILWALDQPIPAE
jgi:nicotinamidase-related amidase/type 1 glutamine amidotransferase